MARTADDLLTAFRLGKESQKNFKEMQIAGRDTPQPGGIPNRPYQAPKEDPKNPYVPAPKKNSLKIASGDADIKSMHYPTEKGFFLDGTGKAYMQTGGKFYDAGEYDVDLHGLPVPLAQQMQINPKVANITPKDFSPPPFRYFNHIRTPDIKKQEMKHMKNFIEAMGGDTKGLVKKNSAMKVYGS